MRFLLRLQAILLAIALMALLAVPAYGWSVITNYLTIADTSPSPGQQINITAKTTYDQAPFPPTLYASNFVTAINYRHFRSPSVYYISGPDGPYIYRSSIGEIDNHPGYFWDESGWFLFLATWEVRATFTAASSCSYSNVRNFHGQTHKHINSSGPDIYRTTNHTAC